MSLRRTRVAFYGGIFLPLAKYLKSDSEFDFSFFWDVGLYEKNKHGYSEDLLSMPHIFVDKFANIAQRYFPRFSRLTQKFKKYDAILVSEEGGIFARAAKRKYIFVPLGYDLSQFATKHSRVQKFLSLNRHRYSRFLREKSIKSSCFVVTTDFPVFRRAITNLGLDNKWLKCFTPTPINWSIFDSFMTSSPDLVLDDTFRVFYPNRVLITKSDKDDETGQTKNTRLALEGYNLFRKNFEGKSKLYIIRRGSEEDLRILDELILDLGISNNIVWLGEESPLTSENMKNMYAYADIVIGDLGSSWFGKTTIEALSQGKPVIGKIEQSLVKQLNEFVGIYPAETAEEIAKILKVFGSYPENVRRKLNLDFRVTYEKHFSPIAVVNFYRTILTGLF